MASLPLPRVSMYTHPLLLSRSSSSTAAAALAVLRIRFLSSSTSSLYNFHHLMSIPASKLPSMPPRCSFFSESSPSVFNSGTLPLCKCFATNGEPTPIGAGEVHSDNLECPLVVVSFYKFADFPDHADLRKPLKELCERLATFFFNVMHSSLSRYPQRVSGGIILAPEGINGSICGTRDCVEEVLSFIQADDRLIGLRRIESPVSPEEEAIHHGHMSSSPLAAGEDAPFRWDHVRVKLKKEIVTLGIPEVSPVERVGKYVNPKEWNELISDPDTVVVDVRNDYETRIGKFKGAVDPCTTAFREFPAWVDDQFKLKEQEDEVKPSGSTENTKVQVEENENKMPRVAMYCTGGIRCEKATSFLLSKGFKEVYHLQGGILKYLEEVPKANSLWEGECFVFDKRVSVEHGLVQGNYKLCYGCKKPVSDEDMESPLFEYAVSCPYCYASKSEEERERARARQRQFERWGIIGGPDKGRKPTKAAPGSESRPAQQVSI